jgi:gliding motility-associated-like protein
MEFRLNTKNNSPLCAGQDLIFNAVGGANYIWTGPNSFFDNIQSPHIFFSSLSDSGMYYVSIRTLGGCYKTDSTKVTVIGTDVNAGPDTAICKGRSVKLNTSRGISYQWFPAEGLSSTTVVNPVSTPDKTTSYTVTVKDKYGCSDTAQVNVVVLNKNEVKAVVLANDYLCRAYDSVYISNGSFGDIKNWEWNFGNGQSSLLENPPVQQYQIPAGINSYNVQLTVIDTAGCADTAYKVLKVVDNCYIAIPNAFTPNNDGQNDYLYPLNAYKATNLSFSVYNRAGQIVFKTTDWTAKWDGTTKGLKQEAGGYVWVLNYNDSNGKKIALKGTTILIR